MRRRGKKRLPTRHPMPLCVPDHANECWFMDFMSDSLQCGRRFCTFNLLDDFNREALAVEIDLIILTVRILRVLDRVIAWRGYPQKIRMDNGPEIISLKLAEWAENNQIELEFIKPGKPTQNSYIERFNRTYRDAILNMYIFKTLNEIRELTETWVKEYNHERPHDSLGDLMPWEYLTKSQRVEGSNFECH